MTTRLTRAYIHTQHTARAAAYRLADRYRHTGGKDDGMGTLEWVVITLGVLLVATAAVVAITAAVNNRLSQIK